MSSSCYPCWHHVRVVQDSIDIVRQKCDNSENGPRNGDRRIAYKVITEKCITVPWLCGDCRPGCPNQAISAAHVIDPARCTECVGAHESPQCAEVCPAGACVPDPDPEHRESREELLEKWRKMHPAEEPLSGTY